MRWLRSFLNSDVLVGEPRDVVLIEAVLAASKLSIPFLTLYLVGARGFDYATAGLFVAIRGLGGLVAVMLAGAIADRFGEKPVVLTLLAGAALSAAAIPHLQSTHALLVGFFLLGAFVNAVQPAFSSLVVRTIPVRHWTEIYAAEYWAMNVGFAFTALVGGQVAVFAFDWLFYLEAVGTFLALVLVARILPATRPQTRTRSPRQRASLRGRGWRALATVSLAARDRLAVVLISSSLLFALCLSQMTGTLPLDMEASGYSPDFYGYVIFWNGALLTIFQIRAGRAIARRRALRILARAAAVAGLGYGLLALPHQHIALILGCLTIWTVGEMMDAPVRSAVVSALAKPGSRARYLGLLSAALTLGYSIGPWLGGYVLQVAGREALWLGTAGCALLCALIRRVITGRVEARILTVPSEPDRPGSGLPCGKR
ncbi:MAG: MFS transporter [Propionibacteriaceae bacterium]|nr:MFS transporter [Propionibacteriaceae bacterium]